MKKLVPVVLETWLKGQPKFLSQYYEVEIIQIKLKILKM